MKFLSDLYLVHVPKFGFGDVEARNRIVPTGYSVFKIALVKAVFAICVFFVWLPAVGAVGVPVRAGLATSALVDKIAAASGFDGTSAFDLSSLNPNIMLFPSNHAVRFQR